jgi:peptidoglycan hydrolase-like protein with peptidoglycan-binding domain
MNRAIPFLMCVLAPAAMLFADGQNFDSKSTPQTAAATIDFKKELGVSSPSLSDLGLRIDTARAAGDPIGLAVIANELAALEKATGKAADIKSDALAAEAIKLAQQRNRSEELKGVAAILPDQATAANLATAADTAAKAEAAAAADKQSGAKGKGIAGILHVDSRIGEPTNIYINGNFVGQIPPGGDGYWNVGAPFGTTFLHAVGAYDGATCDEAVPQVVGDFSWTIYP